MAKNQAEFEALLGRIRTGNITEIELSDKGLNGPDVLALAEALKNHTGLAQLDLTDNDIGPEGAKALAETLKNHKDLAYLNLRYNKIGDTGAKALAEALKNHKGLAALYLDFNQIGPEGAKALAEALKDHTGLTQLHLEYNQIGDTGAKALAAALKNNTGLTQLHLAGNKIGDTGAKALGEALKNHTGLAKLYLYNNKIAPEGAKALAEALKNHKGLAELYLDFNQIGDTGAKALGEALKNHTGLTYLGLENNKIGDTGAKALAAALKNHTGLAHLGLENNKIGDAGAKALVEMLKTNRTLTRIDLKGNNIKESILEEIEGFLLRNRGASEGELQVVQAPSNQIATAEPQKGQATVEGAAVLATERQSLKDEIGAMERAGQKGAQWEGMVARLAQVEGLMQQKADKADVERLGAEKADAGDLRALEARFGELSDVFASLERDLPNALEQEAHNGLQIALKSAGTDIRRAEEIEGSLREFRGFMQRHARQLAKLSDASKISEFEDAQLAAVLAGPGPQFYAYHLVEGLSRVHLAAMVSNSGYYAAEGKRAAMFGEVMEVAGKFIPVVGSYVEVAGMAAKKAMDKITERELAHFAELAPDTDTMHLILQATVRALALENRGKLDKTLCNGHLQKIIQAVFAGKLKHLSAPGKDRQERIVRALVDVAQGREPNVRETQGQGPGTDRPAGIPRDGLPAMLRASIEKQGPLANPDGQKRKTLPAPAEPAPLVGPGALAAFPPELLDIIRSNAEAAQRRLGSAQEVRDSGKGNVIGELQSRLKDLGNPAERDGITPRMLGLGQQGLREPRTAEERNTQNNINARLNDMYELIFKDIQMDAEDMVDLKGDLRAALLDRALDDPMFRAAFLSREKGNQKKVRQALKVQVSNAVGSIVGQGEVDTEALARGIANALAQRIAPQQLPATGRRMSRG